jgi:hypothetical protein
MVIEMVSRFQKRLVLIIIIWGLCSCTLARAEIFTVDDESDDQGLFEKPGKYDFLKNIPSDYHLFWDKTVSRSNILNLTGIAALTSLLIHYDEPVVEEAQRFGERLHISHKTKNVEGFPFMEIPSDFGTSLYFIGDGAVDIGLAAGFLTYGYFNENNRALQTASQLSEGMLTVGITVQILKHTTGRTSPRPNNNKDKWTPFPDIKKYQKNVPSFDAFPSGHLATSMMTFTVITTNYPEYKFIRPLGYTLMGLLSFQMLNNGVHWVSDYPLALYIGYSFGKIASRRNKESGKGESKTSASGSWRMSPFLSEENDVGIAINYTF